MARDDSGKTLLHLAVIMNSKRIALDLLQACSNGGFYTYVDLMKAKDKDGKRPFEYIGKDLSLLSFLEMKGICVH